MRVISPAFLRGPHNRDQQLLPSHSQSPLSKPPAPTCAPAACSLASACFSGPHWLGCHSLVRSPFFPGSSPAKREAVVGEEETLEPTGRSSRNRGTDGQASRGTAYGGWWGGCGHMCPHYQGCLSPPPAARTGSPPPRCPESCGHAPHDPQRACTHEARPPAS